jgi:hypothetical protein
MICVLKGEVKALATKKLTIVGRVPEIYRSDGVVSQASQQALAISGEVQRRHLGRQLHLAQRLRR